MTTPSARCPSCSASLVPGSMFCPECGTMPGPIDVGATCGSCARPIEDDERFCGWCGAAQHTGEGAAGRPGAHEDVTDAQVTLGKYLPPGERAGDTPARQSSGFTGFYSGGHSGGSVPRPGTPTPGSTSPEPARSRVASLPLLLVAALAVVALITSVVVLVAKTTGDEPATADDGRPGGAAATNKRTSDRPTPSTTRSTPPTGTPAGGDGRDSADLAVSLPRVDVPCTDRSSYFIVLAVGAVGDGGKDALVAKLDGAAYGMSGASYTGLRSACSNAFSQKEPNGPAYAAVLGPFDDFGTACSVQHGTHPGTYIKNVRGDAPLTGSSYCFCRGSVPSLGQLSQGSPEHYLVSDAQQVIKQTTDIFGDSRDIFGEFTSTFAARLRAFQAGNELAQTGVLDDATWTALRRNARCSG